MLPLVIVLLSLFYVSANVFLLIPLPALGYFSIGTLLAALGLSVFSAVLEVRIQLQTSKIMKDQIKRNQG